MAAYVLVLAAAVNCAPTAGCPADIRARIRTQADLSRLFYDDKAWVEVLQRVASGDGAWLDVAEYLTPLSDAGATEDLNEALGDAIARSPAEILKRIASGSLHPNGIAICGDIGDPDTLDESLARLSRRERAIRPVREKSLQGTRASCLHQIKNARAAVKKFFRG